VNILIIGGTRFMGPHLVQRLTDDGHAVTLFHRGNTSAVLPTTVRHVHGDRNRLTDFANELDEVAPDVVVDMMLRSEAQAEQLLNLLADRVQRIVMASSCDVYRNFGLLIGSEEGESSSTPLSETSPLRDKRYPYRTDKTDESDPMYWYDKIPIEQMLLSSDPETAVVRLPMIYGPRDYQHRLYEYIKRMDDGRPAIILEEKLSELVFPRAYVEDCAYAMYLATVRDEAADDIFNVADMQRLSEFAWVEAIADVVGWDGDIVVVPRDKLPEKLQSSLHLEHDIAVDSRRIRDVLGYGEQTPFVDTLQQTIEWERANPPEKAPELHYDLEDELLARL